jgi:ParB family chromosome partitioning protein
VSETAIIDARSVAPGDLIIAANVRADTKVDKTFVASIKQHGVIVPIIVEENGDRLEVLDGQRRTIAAVEAGLAAVPVIVQQHRIDSSVRLIEQLVVNDHREELSDAEHTHAFTQLSLFGVSADSIARKTNLPKKRVQLALNVGASEVAGKAMTEHQLSLDQAAVVLEFEDDAEEVAELTASAAAGRFDHVAAEIRARRHEARLISDAQAKLEAAGVQAWMGEIDFSQNRAGNAKHLAYLRDEHGKALTEKNHVDCPYRAVALQLAYQWAGNGREPYVSSEEVCTDWKAAGHTDAYANTSASTSKPEKGSPEAEQLAAERRLVRENNKLWLPATEVRLAFIKDLLQGSEAPAEWERFVAQHCATMYNPTEATAIAKKLLGTADAESLGTWLQASPRKGPHVLVALSLAWYENQYEFSKSGWRSNVAKPYLVQLSKWGYPLSELEERVVQGTASKVEASK